MSESEAAKPSRRERKRLGTRSAIVAAGQQLFASRAMEGVSIDEIVEAADVSKGSFYNHFDDKEHLAAAIIELVQGDLEFRITTANRGIDDPARRIARALCVVIRHAMDHPDRVAAMASLGARKTAADTPLNAGMAFDVGSGLAQQRFRDIDLESGVLIVMGTILITIRHVMSSGSPTKLVDLTATMSLCLLRALGLEVAEARALGEAAARELLDPTLSARDFSQTG